MVYVILKLKEKNGLLKLYISFTIKQNIFQYNLYYQNFRHWRAVAPAADLLALNMFYKFSLLEMHIRTGAWVQSSRSLSWDTDVHLTVPLWKL